MTIHNLLETFDTQSGRKTGKKSEPLGAADIEQLKSQAFEAGYASGWEDALKSDTEARQRVEAEFERNIQSIAFTYNEAVDRVRGELKAFVESLIEGFFPALAPELLREHVRSELIRIADDFVEVPLEIVASPDCNPLLSDMLDADFSMEITLVEDASLAERQVFIRIAEREIEIDLSPLVVALKDQFLAIQENPQEKEAKNG